MSNLNQNFTIEYATNGSGSYVATSGMYAPTSRISTYSVDSSYGVTSGSSGLANGTSNFYSSVGSSASSSAGKASSYSENASAGGALSYSGNVSAGGALSYSGNASAGGASSYSFSESTNIGSAGNATGGSVFATVGGSASVFLSQIEAAILRSTMPIEINETEEITVIGQKGVWANKAEVINWRGVIPITEYIINEDQNPEIINKKVSQSLEYIQELAIRYLRPPTPPAPGEIIIKQEANISTPPAPPLIIRQQPPRPPTPEPLVIREAPPQQPVQVGRKVITISGKRIPPAPRKVIIERLPPLPSKPQSVLIERWLPYPQIKRKVIFQGNNLSDPIVAKPKNVIVQWDSPNVVIKKEVKYLGVSKADPNEYIQKYNNSIKISRELPQYVVDIKTPDGLVLAANYQYNSVFELEGDVKALELIDLDREGLGEYRSQLQGGFRINSSSISSTGSNSNFVSNSTSFQNNTINFQSTGFKPTTDVGKVLLSRLNSYFKKYDMDRDGYISKNDFMEYGRRLIQLGNVKDHKRAEQILKSVSKFSDYVPNEKINFDQYVKIYAEKVMTGDPFYYHEQLENMFKALDADLSGYLEYQEFQIHLRALNINDERIIKSAFNSIDVDGNGKLSYEEFAKAGMNYFLSNNPNSSYNYFFGDYQTL